MTDKREEHTKYSSVGPGGRDLTPALKIVKSQINYEYRKSASYLHLNYICGRMAKPSIAGREIYWK